MTKCTNKKSSGRPWCRDTTERKKLLDQIDEMRSEIVKNPVDQVITLDQLNRALARTPLKTGLGSDQLEP